MNWPHIGVLHRTPEKASPGWRKCEMVMSFLLLPSNPSSPNSLLHFMGHQNVMADRCIPYKLLISYAMHLCLRLMSNAFHKLILPSAENTPTKRLLNRQSIVPAKVIGISLNEDLEKITKPKTAPER